MRIGIDVGGTHTDAVAINESGVIASVKIPTRHDNLADSVISALNSVLDNHYISLISGITLSTTLATNAILEGKIDRVGTIVSSGPGIDPENYRIGEDFYVIDGSIDHRGVEQKNLNQNQLDKAIKDCRNKGLKAFAAITKFSIRNPRHELHIEESIDGDCDFITLGHRVSGSLNFPRRINTAFYNSAVWREYNEFADAAEKALARYGVKIVVNTLKADGGTIPLEESRAVPAQLIFSGPAASVMGAAALCDIRDDAVILDIGGTSTDISIFAAGSPLLEREGACIAGRPTLTRSIMTQSIAIGGDSRLNLVNGVITVGPERLGPSLSNGGPVATLTDALNAAGYAEFGDITASRAGIHNLAKTAGRPLKSVADEAISFALNKISTAVKHMIDALNQKPVYTIHEILHTEKIRPSSVYIIGGPAKALSGLLSTEFGIPVIAPEFYSVANAIGAALTRPTKEMELFADTERGIMTIPSLSLHRAISRGYSIDEAVNDLKKFLSSGVDEKMNYGEDAPSQVVYAHSFNMVKAMRTVGKNIRVKAQIKPGHIKKYLEAVRRQC